MEKKLNNKTYDKILTTAYFIVLNVFKKNISTRQSMASKTLKYSSLSSSDKAKCNDLVQKVLRFTVYLDPWINRNKKGRLRIEIFCLVRLASRYFGKKGKAGNCIKKIFRTGVFF